MNVEYKAFQKTEPTMDAYETMLKYYMAVENDIMHVTPVHNIGALSLETQPLKYSLKAAAAAWKTQYAQNLHEKAKSELDAINEYMAQTTKALSRPINDLEDVRLVMNTLQEVREKESEIDLQFGPVEEMYSLLSRYVVSVPK
jgi:dynein heavy chain